jgi:hypothetical protein
LMTIYIGKGVVTLCRLTKPIVPIVLRFLEVSRVGTTTTTLCWNDKIPSTIFVVATDLDFLWRKEASYY